MNGAIVIAGFMGVGKTTVGRLVAERLDRPFFDLDDLIVELSGCSIPTLFAEGEAVFRWWEQVALARIDLAEPIVLAVGGGTLVGRWNQLRVAGATTVVIDAAPEEIFARLSRSRMRPLAAEAPRLYERRRAAYNRLPITVLSRGRSPARVAREVVTVMKQYTAGPSTSGPGHSLIIQTPQGDYPVHVRDGVAAGIGGWLSRIRPGAVALITDSTVGPLWGEAMRHDLLAARLPTTLIEIPAGEAHKTLDTVSQVYDQLLDAGIDRSGAIVALGGGVVGDLAGFVAATWMRGVRGFVQVPTTVLSMVDASVGGKTGVDHPRGKNLIGAFRQPDMVLVDPEFLRTLPPREVSGGLAEVIKHGIIADPALFEAIGADPPTEHTTPREWEDLLATAVRIKAEIVERDPFEQGERAKLNLGHTFGHAYELMSDFALSHGEAVSAGMVTAAQLAEAMGIAEPGLAARISRTLASVSLPTRWSGGVDGQSVWRVMQSDKKKGAHGLRFVLPRAIGDVIVTEPGSVDPEVVIQIIERQSRGGG